MGFVTNKWVLTAAVIGVAFLLWKYYESTKTTTTPAATE